MMGAGGQGAGGDGVSGYVVVLSRMGLAVAVWRPGGWRGGSRTYLGPRALMVPGDMMIDRVSPALRGCGRSFFSGRPRGGGRTVVWPELAAVGSRIG
jgi:hypothetical protein